MRLQKRRRIIASKTKGVSGFCTKGGELMTTQPMLKMLSLEEVAELRATPGVTFPARVIFDIELSAQDAICEGVVPMPPGADWADYGPRPVVHGAAGSALAAILFDAVHLGRQRFKLQFEGCFCQAVRDLADLGRVTIHGEEAVE